MAAYRQLMAAGVPTRLAALLTGISPATATRKPTVRLHIPAPPLVPANKLNSVERDRIFDTVNSPAFVDLPPIFAQLLDQGVYLGSISTIYGQGHVF